MSASGYPGWERNSRSSGGFEQLLGIVAHHTASDTSPANDLNYMVNGPDNPISNGLLDRSGHFTIIAGGASNHAGKGGGSAEGGGTTWHCSKGTVPADSGNSRCFGIEAANNGVGQPWPQDQQDAYTLMCALLSNAYGLVMPSDLRSHAEWSPPRKIDPRGPAKWQPANANSPWAMDGFRSDVAARMVGVPPGPSPTGDLMLTLFHSKQFNAKFMGLVDSRGFGHTVSWVDNESIYNWYKNDLKTRMQEVALSDMGNLFLVGMLPEGDALHTWVPSDFAPWSH